MPLAEIEALMKNALGLKITSVSQSTLGRAVRRRMDILSLPDEEAYIKKVSSSVIELNELIEEVVIPETWFFRDKGPFELLKKHINTVWVKENKAFVRLLSAPCSTGEEPYTLAMSLLDAGWPASKFQIVAVDISHRSLARAQQGIYTRNSFRTEDISFQSKYFTQNGNEYVLNRDIRNKVLFRHGNILNTGFMGSLGVFDVIFCKNVLIYLDEKSRQQAITLLYKQLVPYGLLFVGHAEASLVMGSKFLNLQHPQAFVFQKPGESSEAAHFPYKLKKNEQPDTKSRTLFSRPPVTAQQSIDLGLAKKFADQGLIKEAIEICEANLREKGPSPHGYFLLGLTRDANGETDKALQMFRKAIYLDPDHMESLVNLSLLSERIGDTRTTSALKQRIRRLESQQKYLAGSSRER